MPIIRAQVTIPAASTVGEDKITNTWHFTTTGWNETIQGQVATALMDWYEDLDSLKGNLQAWTSARVKFFNLEDPEPRVPLDDISLGLTAAPAGSPLPPELAVCMSYSGDYVSGESQARRRGRIFFGGLSVGMLNTDSRWSTAVSTAVSGAGGALLTTSNLASDWAWVVYSPSGNQAYPVTGGWVDNAPDIQRRRGLLATTRTLF